LELPPYLPSPLATARAYGQQVKAEKRIKAVGAKEMLPWLARGES
jgi:hypothetical protein